MALQPRKSSRANIQIFSLREQKAIVRYLHLQDTDSSEIHKLLIAACGVQGPSYKECREWVSDIVEGREEPDLCVCQGGRKKTVGSSGAEPATDPTLVIRLENLILVDQRVSIEQLADFTGATLLEITEIISSCLNLKRVGERWVQRMWTPEQRFLRINTCKYLIELYQKETIEILNRIIVADDTFVLYHSHDKVVRKDSTVKYKMGQEPTRVYCCFFYDIKGLLAYDMLPYTEIPTATEYINTLKEILVPALNRKRPGLDRPYYLLHSQSSAHTSPHTQEALKELNIVPFPHTALSPDLEPFEYWLFRNLKRTIGGVTFKNRTDLWSALQRQMHSLTEQEFNNSIFRIRDRWQFCIEKDGLYLL